MPAFPEHPFAFPAFTVSVCDEVAAQVRYVVQSKAGACLAAPRITHKQTQKPVYEVQRATFGRYAVTIGHDIGISLRFLSVTAPEVPWA